MRKPTLKQQRFILAFIKNGGNATQAALAAYDTTYATARVIGCENLTKPTIRREIDRLMKAVQLSAKDCLRAIKDALEAVDKDDAGKGGKPNVVPLAGNLETVDQGDRFSMMWKQLLDDYGLDCFHMTDYCFGFMVVYY